MKYAAALLLLLSTHANAFIINASNVIEVFPGQLYSSVPGDSYQVSRSINSVIENAGLTGNASLSEMAHDYAANPELYNVKVSNLEVMFIDSISGPNFSAQLVFPNGFSLLHFNPANGNETQRNDATTQVNDQDTLDGIGSSRILAYDLIHLSGELSSVTDIEHNMTIEVTKILEPSSNFLLALALMLLILLRTRRHGSSPTYD